MDESFGRYLLLAHRRLISGKYNCLKRRILRLFHGSSVEEVVWG